MEAASPSQTQSFGQTEINWDKLDKTKFYVVGAGIFTGLTLALYPVSLVKTRLQVASKDTVERNAFSVIRGILRTDGIPGLYRGFGTVITGAIPTRILFLTALETTKVAAFRLVEPFKLSEPTEAAIANGIAGMAASVCSQTLFVPIDVVSQRLMVQGYSGHATYNGGLDVVQKVLKSDGIRGLYRGFGLSVITYSPSSAVWWASYGSSQRLIWRLLGHGTEHESAPSHLTIACVQASGGIFAGATASFITTPLDTIKTRLQVMGHEDRRSIRQVVKGLVIDDGWKGLYRGLGPRFFSMSAWGTSMILAYEYLSRDFSFTKLLHHFTLLLLLLCRMLRFLIIATLLLFLSCVMVRLLICLWVSHYYCCYYSDPRCLDPSSCPINSWSYSYLCLQTIPYHWTPIFICPLLIIPFLWIVAHLHVHNNQKMC